MFCEAYRQSLEDAAAGATAPPHALAHLAACRRCSDAFAKEQAVHSGIDAGLTTIANAPVPPSLLPRIREVVSQERISFRFPHHGWVLVSSVAVAALMFAVSLPRLFKPVEAPGPVVVVEPSPNTRSARDNRQPVGPSAPRQGRTQSAEAIFTASRPSAADPEVLVPAGQEVALRRYAEILQKSTEPLQLMAPREIQRPLTIEAIEISALEGEDIQIDPLVRDTQDLSR
jgi:hypothetical protein